MRTKKMWQHGWRLSKNLKVSQSAIYSFDHPLLSLLNHRRARFLLIPALHAQKAISVHRNSTEYVP